jgi:two-component system sensor histidine kinase HydH
MQERIEPIRNITLRTPMYAFDRTTRSSGMKTSPWIILGSTAILLVVVIAMAIQNTHREKRYMSEVLSAKGAALIRAVEAGARTGMMGMMWGGRHLQRLLEETTRLPDVLYMAIVDAKGVALAHSDTSKINTVFRLASQDRLDLKPNEEEQWELVDVEPDGRAFEIRRHFRPLSPGGRRGFGRMGDRMHRHADQPQPSGEWFEPEKQQPLLIVAGLDTAPFEAAIRQDMRTTLVLSAILLLLGFGGFVSLFWMNSYRSAKRSLQDSSAFADKVVASLPVGLVAMDGAGRITFYNATAGRITGIEPEHAIGRRSADLLPELLGDLQKELDRGRTITEREMDCTFLNGIRAPISISATRIINEAGDLVGQVLILRDLGELRQLQATVQRQEKLAAIGGLAAGVAHEIRNPLSSIKGLAAFFKDRLKDDTTATEAAEVMSHEVDRLNRTITELLDFAKPSDLKRRTADLSQVILRSLELIRQDAENQKIAIETAIEKVPCTVHIDPDRLTQCLLNLFLNAVQAMADGGTLTVACRSNGSRFVDITVSDTGTGIAKDQLGQVFDPYFTTKSDGTGLGLAIVHKIIEAHDGTVHADSSPGSGTTFTLRIPCNAGDEERRPS